MYISDAAKRSGLSQDTIRFYHKSGMLPPLPRDEQGWRLFRKSDVDWLITLERLRATGMPLSEVKRFATSAHAENCDSDAERKMRLEILQNHKVELGKNRAALDACDAYLTHKITIYSAPKEP